MNSLIPSERRKACALSDQVPGWVIKIFVLKQSDSVSPMKRCSPALQKSKVFFFFFSISAYDQSQGNKSELEMRDEGPSSGSFGLGQQNNFRRADDHCRVRVRERERESEDFLWPGWE